MAALETPLLDHGVAPVPSRGGFFLMVPGKLRTRRGQRVCAFAAILACLALALGLSLFFLWPRPPIVAASAAGFSRGELPLSIHDGKMTLDILVRVRVQNDNFVAVTLANISLDVAPLCLGKAAGQSRPVGHISLPEEDQADGVDFPGRQTKETNLYVSVVTTDVDAIACMSAELLLRGDVAFSFSGPAELVVLRDIMVVELDFTESFRGNSQTNATR